MEVNLLKVIQPWNMEVWSHTQDSAPLNSAAAPTENNTNTQISSPSTVQLE